MLKLLKSGRDASKPAVETGVPRTDLTSDSVDALLNFNDQHYTNSWWLVMSMIHLI